MIKAEMYSFEFKNMPYTYQKELKFVYPISPLNTECLSFIFLEFKMFITTYANSLTEVQDGNFTTNFIKPSQVLAFIITNYNK